MAKAKFDAKAFLLKRGETLVMGVAGFFLVVLLIWGVSEGTSAQDPAKTANDLKSKSERVYASIEGGTPDPADVEKLKMPPFLVGGLEFKSPKVPDFNQTGPLFDPTAQPNTKRENPLVLNLGQLQIDLTRGAMLGYDIVSDGDESIIAVLTSVVENKLDDGKIKEAADKLRASVRANRNNRTQLGSPQPPPAGPGGMPPGPGGMPGPGGLPPGGMPGPGGLPPGGMPGPGGGRMGMGGPHGFPGGFNQDAQRTEKAIKYVPLNDLDAAVKAGNLPAFTVIPLRLVTVHAVVPYKKQVDEIKRALRLPVPSPKASKDEIEKAEQEARQWGPWYDGFEVQRRVTRLLPDGTVQVLNDWPQTKDLKDTKNNYKFEELYIDKIDTRKIADHFDEGFLPYFLKPEMMLAMPLPQLAKDLNVKYPEVTLKDITDNIKKLEESSRPKPSQSELLKQVSGRNGRDSIYKPKTSDNVGGLGYDPKNFGTPGMAGAGPTPPGGPKAPLGGGPGRMAPGGAGSPKFPEGFGPTGGADVPTDIDNFLLRFVDCDAQPGFTYEYRIRLRMLNPNFGQDKLVSVPEYAKDAYKVLYSKWTQTDAITVPAESFLYAHDVKAYREKIDSEYPPQTGATPTNESRVNKLLQVKENQAVLEVATWMEQVRTGGGSQREPVGAWVVAEMPVGRAEFIGRKQFIKLPLWSAEAQQYRLREVGDRVVPGKVQQPRGWLVDFATNSVLVDFEGGRVKTRTNVRFDEKGNVVTGGARNIDEDAATEVLILRPDGRMVVRSSKTDGLDPNRKAITTEWARWVKEVEARKTAGAGAAGETNQFDKPKGP